MSLAERTSGLNLHGLYENGLISSITEILRVSECSKNLMIGIYLIKNARFLYCNQGLKNIVGNTSNKLFTEGWDFWYSRIDPKEVFLIKNKLTEFFLEPFSGKPLTLLYHVTDSEGRRISIKHEVLLHRLKRQELAVNYLFDISDKERIEHCFDIPKDKRDVHFPEEDNLHISVREKEVLQLIANGFSSKEIADMLFISNHTAISHRKNLIEKFNVRNTAQLIKRASKVMEL
ncbi:response regulator transcription factor [Maribacter halichondriae]|uniref:response regulator transcription factor n=1 Tax=Maribacter halichondriae TaxID=2980554 RepID=UPI002359583D|nr:helix-turn-helix transcriptional regulator [Maribacter sp. Hal144]